MSHVRYARQIALAEIGPQGQRKIAAARALIVGLGGLGCPAAQYLASSGMGGLVLNDFDRVDESNLPRQILFAPQDVGALKVEAARRRLLTMNPAVDVECLTERLDAAQLRAAVESVNVVLDCTDNFTVRQAINAACVAAGVVLVSGAAVRLEGQIAVFPNRGEGPCYRCIYNDEDEWLGNCQGNGVLAPVPGVIGAMMAVETLRIATGARSALESRLLLWDATFGQWQAVAIRPDPQCPVCQDST
jgi:adenylyltransferase/sulfurtransferase